MSIGLQRKAQRLILLLEKLGSESKKGILIIVEGHNDVKALRQLAIEGKVISTKTSGKSFLDLLAEVEEQKVGEVVLLLDFDRRGVEWTRRLKQHLEKTRIKPNLNFWNELYSLVGHDVKDLEGLPAYLETLRRKASSTE